MNDKPLVSIGVPVYNGGKYLEECLNSIKDQTWQNWECVIIDNCSKDDTNDIAKKFEGSDNRFRLIKNTDFVDQTTNWNIAFKNLSNNAKYSKILCADDWIYPGHIEKMVEIMEKYPSVGICSSYRLDDIHSIGDGLDIYKGPFFKGHDILIGQLFYRYDLLGSVSTVIYRSEILKKVKGYPDIFKHNTYHIDTELSFEVLNMSDFGYVFQITSYTRRHNETYTNLISNRFNTGLYFREKEIFKYMGLDPELAKEYKKVRRDYAFMLIEKRFKGDKDCIAWHNKYLDKERQFKTSDYLGAFIYRLIKKIF